MTSAADKPATTRRRGDALQDAIFDAVFDQLRTVGYGGLTMDGIAATARTGKAAIYRRWDNKTALIQDAVRNALPSPAKVPVTDDLRADLLALLRCVAKAYDVTDGPSLHLLLVETGSDCRAVVNAQVIEPCRRLIQDALERGAARGEVAPGVATRLVASIGPAIIIQQALLEGTTVRDDDVIALVDNVLLPLTRSC